MESFVPPFCPNPACPFHCGKAPWRYIRAGFFSRKRCEPQRIQRYRCLHCRRTFSSQTFSLTYWLHKPALLERIFYGSLSCSGLRQMAHEIGLSPATIQSYLSRLGRHCLLYQHARLKESLPREEPLVLDGFESFEYSQYFPFHFHVLIGKHSHFFYLFADSPLRRKGRMTDFQRRKREKLEQALGRPDPKSIEKEVAGLLRRTGSLFAEEPRTLLLYSDDHPAYPRAFRRVPGLTIEHHVTSSLARRTTRNPLFPVNLVDLLIRHGGANHKRETIAFSKRRQGAIERLAIFQVWRNFMRSFTERRRKGGPTPAQRAGVMERKLSLRELLARRLFFSRGKISEPLGGYYRREVRTRALRVNREHRLRYAF